MIDSKGWARPHITYENFIALFLGPLCLNGEFRGFHAPEEKVCASVGSFMARKSIACLFRDLLEKGGWVSVLGSK